MSTRPESGNEGVFGNDGATDEVQEGFANFEDSCAQEVGLLNLINTRRSLDDAVIETKPRWRV